MRGWGILRSILKLLVIFLTVSAHHPIALRHAGIFLMPVAGLVVTPLWNDTYPNLNHSCLIDNATANQGTLTFQSSSEQTCSLKLSTSNEFDILIQTTGAVSDDDIFHVERLNGSAQCPTRFVAIHGQNACNATFADSNLQVNLQSNTGLSIQKVNISGSMTKCPEVNQNRSTDLDSASDCSSIQGYDNVTSCNFKYSKWSESLGICYYTFLSVCNITILNKEAILQCPESETSQNQIYLLPPPKPSVLEIGYYAENSITDRKITIDFDSKAFVDFQHIQALYLEGCNMLDIDPELLKPLQNLKFLNLKFNRFGLSDFREDVFMYVTNLTHLYLSVNEFRTLPTKLLHRMVNLEEIRLDRNNLTTLNITFFKGLVQLVHVNLNDNGFSTLPVGLFDGLESLELLQMKRNKITHLESGVFRNLTNLKTLNLLKNSLKTLPPDIFQGLKSLSKIILRSNKLSHLPNETFQGLGKLNEIQVGYNNFSKLTDGLFHNINKLRLLSLQFNQLNSVGDLFEPNKTLNKFENLNLAFNNLEALPKIFLDILPNLQQIRLNHNKFTKLDTELFKQYFKDLSFIDVSGNVLEDIPKIHNSTKLKLLAASQNPLAEVTKSTFFSLTENTKLLVSQHEICECFVPPGVKCFADGEANPYLTCDKKDRLLDDSILRLSMWIIGLTIIGGNLFLLEWRQGQTHAANTAMQSILIINLAVANLIMGIYVIMIAFADIYFGRHFYLQSTKWRSGLSCKIAGFFCMLSCEASIFFITLISFERVVSIMCLKSKKKYKKKFAFISVLFSWILALAISIAPCVFTGDLNFYDYQDECVTLPFVHGLDYSIHPMDDSTITKFVKLWELSPFYYEANYVFVPLYSIIIFLGFNGFCLLLTLVCLIGIACCCTKRSDDTEDMKSQVTLTKRIVAIVFTSCLCWFIIVILGFLVQFGVLSIPRFIYPWLVVFVFCINAALNPFLYLSAVLITKCCRKKEVPKESQNSVDMNKNEDEDVNEKDDKEVKEGGDVGQDDGKDSKLENDKDAKEDKEIDAKQDEDKDSKQDQDGDSKLGKDEQVKEDENQNIQQNEDKDLKENEAKDSKQENENKDSKEDQDNNLKQVEDEEIKEDENKDMKQDEDKEIKQNEEKEQNKPS